MTQRKNLDNSSQRDRIKQLDRDISALRTQNHFVENPEQKHALYTKYLNEKMQLLSQHTSSMQEVISNLQSRSENPTESDKDEMDVAIRVVNQSKEAISRIKNEIRELQSKINEFESTEYKKYKELIAERNRCQNALDNFSRQPSASAFQTNPDKNGRALIQVGLLHGEIQKDDWRNAFHSSHKFRIDNAKSSDQNIQFISDDNKQVINIDNDRVKLLTPMPTIELEMKKVVNSILDLYLKCIQDQKVYGHEVHHENQKVKEHMEITLANKLIEKGLANGKINSRDINDIIASARLGQVSKDLHGPDDKEVRAPSPPSMRS